MKAALSEYGRLTKVLVKHARDAFVSENQIAAQWKWLNYSAPPDFSRALEEYERFMEIIASSGAEIVYLPRRRRLDPRLDLHAGRIGARR